QCYRPAPATSAARPFGCNQSRPTFLDLFPSGSKQSNLTNEPQARLRGRGRGGRSALEFAGGIVNRVTGRSAGRVVMIHQPVDQTAVPVQMGLLLQPAIAVVPI